MLPKIRKTAYLSIQPSRKDHEWHYNTTLRLHNQHTCALYSSAIVPDIRNGFKEVCHYTLRQPPAKMNFTGLPTNTLLIVAIVETSLRFSCINFQYSINLTSAAARKCWQFLFTYHYETWVKMSCLIQAWFKPISGLNFHCLSFKPELGLIQAWFKRAWNFNPWNFKPDSCTDQNRLDQTWIKLENFFLCSLWV